jgi:outer membrane protein assembly factor BamB
MIKTVEREHMHYAFVQIKLKEEKNKMKMLKNKIAAITIAIFFMLSMTASMIPLPTANAHTPAWTIPTYAFINVSPNPIGIGQEVFVNFWIDKPPQTANGFYGDRWTNFTVTVTKPDGTTETLGPFTADDTGGTHTTYTPTILGNYTFVFHFAGQTLVGANPAPTGTVNPTTVGDYYQPSTSRTATLTVQQAQIQPYPSTPLPSGYWQRPIFAENTNWYIISGNWLGAGSYNASQNFDPYSTAPTTAHIVWTKTYAGTPMGGGLIGGEFGGAEVNSNYYSTAQYETKFAPIIMNGVLYYTLVPGSMTSPESWVAVDIRTGQTLWTKTIPSTAQSGIFGTTAYYALIRGILYDYTSPNQYGALAYLWDNEPTVAPNTGSTYGLYDAMTGNWILSIVNATGATWVSGPTGELLGYYMNSTDHTINMWNLTRAIYLGPTGTGDLNNWLWRPQQGASIPWKYGIQWTAPMTTTMKADNGTTVNIDAAYAQSSGVPNPLAISKFADAIIVTDIPGPTVAFNQPGYIVAEGYSTIDGHLLWGPLNITQTPWSRLSLSSIGDGVWTIFTSETQSFTGYSTTTGQKLWGPVSIANTNVPWGYFVTASIIANGNLYSTDFSGYVNCLDVQTGTIKWTTNTGTAGYESPYGVWPLVNLECFADGKLFAMGGHLYSPPLFHGGLLYCFNGTTGDLLWTNPSFAITNGPNVGLADGYLIVPNAYDEQLYCYNKGQSAITVAVSNGVGSQGSPVLLQGTVTDQSPGQTCLGIPAKGTPAISDAIMSAWMEYLYQQQPMPTNATGVPVTLSVIDSNGNYRQIGNTTSDATGTFGFTWTPDIPGQYTVIATFAGSQSYYASSAETYFYASAPAATPAPTATPAASVVDTYFVPAVIAIIVVIIIGFAVLFLALRKRP